MAEMVALAPDLPLSRLCALAGISRSWWYARPDADAMAARDTALVHRIGEIVDEHPGYGYRRVTAVLQQAGMGANHKRVQRLMREHTLGVKRRPRRTATTIPSEPSRSTPNRIRDLVVTGRDQVWVADLTYLALPRGFAYLACLLDAWSRRCLGWSVGRYNTTALAVAALDQAIALRQPQPGLIHHSDQGTTYTSAAYRARLAEIGALCSMSAKGTPVENAIIESFFKTLKQEEVNRQEYATVTEADELLRHYIDGYYNPIRLHSSLGYTAPMSFEAADVVARTSEL